MDNVLDERIQTPLSWKPILEIVKQQLILDYNSHNTQSNSLKIGSVIVPWMENILPNL